MNRKFYELFEIAQKVFSDECKAELDVLKEEYGTKIFPYMSTIRGRRCIRYWIEFNPRIEVVLSLYNIAVISDINIGVAIAYYILFYECLSLDRYCHARLFFTRFTEEIQRLRLKERMEEMGYETNGFIRYQVLFTLFHEISHEYYRQFSNCHATATATSKRVMESLKGPYTEIFTEENFAKGMMRDDVKNFILSQIPEGSSDEEIKRIVEEHVALYHYLTDLAAYIDQLTSDKDKQFLDEISCDRNAFIIFMRWAKKRHLPDDMVSLLHDILYVAVNAMDNVKVLQTYCNPPRGNKDMPYDPRQIVLRQRALVTNKLVFLGKKYKDVDEYYKELNTTLETLMTTALSTMRRHEKLICGILERRENNRLVDSAMLVVLRQKMEDLVSGLVKDYMKPCPLDEFPMAHNDFVDDESLGHLLMRYLRVKRTGRYT